MQNLFSSIPQSLASELTETLIAGSGVRIERIVSTGHTTAAGDWYDQGDAEWVVVLQGDAEIRFEDDRIE